MCQVGWVHASNNENNITMSYMEKNHARSPLVSNNQHQPPPHPQKNNYKKNWFSFHLHSKFVPEIKKD